MFLNKMKFVLALVMLVGILGATGLGYRAGGTATAAAQPETSKPASEVEALRKEVELLRLNLLVVLEKVRAQEAELSAFRRQGGKTTGGSMSPGPVTRGVTVGDFDNDGRVDVGVGLMGIAPRNRFQEAEDALKALRSARDKASEQRALEVLEKALKKLKGK